jgi:FkbM family methyltransferase
MSGQSSSRFGSSASLSPKQFVKKFKRLSYPLRHRMKARAVEWRTEREIRRRIRTAPVVLEDVNGIRFVLPPGERPYARHHLERREDRSSMLAMRQLIRPGDVVLDVGAHIGIFSVFAAGLVGLKGAVYAFEPVPDTYWRMLATLVLNRRENVTAIPKAIGDKVGTVRMNLFEPEHSGWNTLGKPLMLTPEGRRVRPLDSINVVSDTLDNFCAEVGIDRVNFLKVDVEGFEKFVFLGASRLLSDRRVDFICFEISRDPLLGAGVKPWEVFETLESYGYLVYRFEDSKQAFMGPIHDSDEYWANYFASHQDLAATPGASVPHTDTLRSIRAAPP